MNAAEKTIYTEELYSIQQLPTVLLTKPWLEVNDAEKNNYQKSFQLLDCPWNG